MIEVKGMDNIPYAEIVEEDIKDVNSGIHKEYNLLVFRYANLLKEYLDLKKEYIELTSKNNETVKELIELKEMHRKGTVRFCGRIGEEDDLK